MQDWIPAGLAAGAAAILVVLLCRQDLVFCMPPMTVRSRTEAMHKAPLCNRKDHFHE
jgi:hypothetical protein